MVFKKKKPQTIYILVTRWLIQKVPFLSEVNLKNSALIVESDGYREILFVSGGYRWTRLCHKLKIPYNYLPFSTCSQALLVTKVYM